MSRIKVGIIGAAGYTAGELIRILLNHPLVDIVLLQSKSQAGKPVHSVHQDLLGDSNLLFQDIAPGPSAGQKTWQGADLLFLCAGHGQAQAFLQAYGDSLQDMALIDLSHDFRIAPHPAAPGFQGPPFVYGLPELNRDQIRRARRVANPGCFASAIQLGLLPLAKAGLLGEIFTTGITGSTGAGQSLSPTTHFSWRANNIQAYKTLTHQHLSEIHQSLHQLQPGFPGPVQADAGSGKVHFVPWRGDFTRGIFVSSQTHSDLDAQSLTRLYQDFYKDHPFTHLSLEPIHLKQVVNTNKCLIQLEKQGSYLVIHSIIDNLVKGASGQAIQNMNLMFGLEETMGLHLKGSFY